MTLLAQELQKAKIGFVDAQAVHMSGGVKITRLIVNTPEDLARFADWADGNPQVSFIEDDVRIATLEELQEAAQRADTW